jgi:hypothetical protein
MDIVRRKTDNARPKIKGDFVVVNAGCINSAPGYMLIIPRDFKSCRLVYRHEVRR